MLKKGVDTLSDKQARINLVFFLMVLVVFVMTLIYVEGFSITLATPSNHTYNGTKAINFSFTTVFDGPEVDAVGAEGRGANCSIWSNTSGAAISWTMVNFNSSRVNTTANISVNNSRSFINYSFQSDGNYTYNVACWNLTLNDWSFPAQRSNLSFFIDTVAPQVFPLTPSGTFTSGEAHNITSYDSALLYINVTDNSTKNVWVIFSDLPSIFGDILGGNNNDTNATQATIKNQSMSLNKTLAQDRNVYILNISNLLNFSSNYTGPGAHGVYFCANDSLSRVTCSSKRDLIITGGKVNQIEEMFSEMTHPVQGTSFGGLNITYGNGSEIPNSTFFTPLTPGNYTFIVNFSSKAKVYIVGAKIDENQLGNASRINFSDTLTSQAQEEAGQGYKANLTFMDIKSFIPSSISYTFGIIRLPEVYNKVEYCNGTSIADPSCRSIEQCNATAIGLYNYTDVLPLNSSVRACWLKSGRWGETDGSSGQPLAAGFTYIFVKTFSGGLGGNDRGGPAFNFTTPTSDIINVTNLTTQMINFTVFDSESTGVNLTKNGTVNVTVLLSGDTGQTELIHFVYRNDSSLTNLTCTTPDVTSPGNTTDVFCNVTLTMSSKFGNGTFIVNVSSSDASNNTNFGYNVTTIIVDQRPPLFVYYNFTNSSVFATNDTNISGMISLDTSDHGSRRQGRRDISNTGSPVSSATIFVAANWTDNLTLPQHALLQFFNQSSAAWQTVNNTPVNFSLNRGSGWTNLSFFIPGGHNEFEGRNVSFRVIANDTVGNLNSSLSVKNFTILINDTTGAAINITGTIGVNNTNISSTSIDAGWAIVTEPNALSEINITIDGNYNVNPADGCNKSARFTSGVTGPANVERQKNGTMTMSTDPACVLGNGSHYIEVIAKDSWGNVEIVFRNFTVESGSIPVINLTNLSLNLRVMNYSIKNQSNVTPFTGLNFTAMTSSTTSKMKNFTWTSSCNSTVTLFDGLNFVQMNASRIWPFNYSSCRDTNAEANRTVTVTAYDFAGNSKTELYEFFVDNLGPPLTVNYPTDGVTVSGVNITFNISAQDGSLRLASVGYFLDDGIEQGLFNSLNLSGSLGKSATNITIETSRNISGTHRIKFTANDTLGNVRNSSVLTFTQQGAISMLNSRIDINGTINSFNSTNNATVVTTNITLLNSSGDVQESAEVGQTLQLYMAFNATVKGINLTVNFNGSAANWNRTNDIYIVINSSTAAKHLLSNQTANVINSVFVNESFANYLGDNNSYYGKIKFANINSSTLGGQYNLYYFADEKNFALKNNITKCQEGLVLTHGLTSGLPCWNVSTSNLSIDVYVPHFSVVAEVNDTTAPTINVTSPEFNNTNQTVSMFVPNITVSADTESCKYIVNGTTANKTMTKQTLPFGTICFGSTERFKNLTDGQAYNINFTVIDTAGNERIYAVFFNVSDTTPPSPANESAVSSSVGSTSATITVGVINESVNVTVSYGTDRALGSSKSETDFNQSQEISLSSLSASTQYYFNVTTCDFNGNCQTNGTFNFTTSAAAAAAAAAASTASSGGGGGGAVAETNIASSVSKAWSTVSPSLPAIMTINKPEIGVTEISVNVKSEATGVDIKVDGLKSNPKTDAPASKVYQYLQITKTNLDNTIISSATIKFKVSKSWLTSNNVQEDNVALYRYTTKWEQLSTTKISSDSTVALYESTTPGFSTFAIGIKSEVKAPIITPEVTPTPVSAEEKPVPTGEAVAEGPREAVKAKPKGQVPVVLIIIILAVVALLGYFWYTKKKAK